MWGIYHIENHTSTLHNHTSALHKHSISNHIIVQQHMLLIYTNSTIHQPLKQWGKKLCNMNDWNVYTVRQALEKTKFKGKLITCTFQMNYNTPDETKQCHQWQRICLSVHQGMPPTADTMVDISTTVHAINTKQYSWYQRNKAYRQ
jgi:2-succinyl-5-enolpyruvyl-6-hydroxy-3-cyclohexene-1-carboxylate synthase